MRMADEVRVFAAKRGVDLSAFTLLPFGGAGAVHAAAVAEELGMRRILVPPRPGRVLGARACSAPTWCTTTSAPSCARWPRSRPTMPRTIFRQLEAKAREELRAEGMNPADARFARELDLRYTGQGYELRTPLDGLFAERLTRGVARRRARKIRRAARADPRPCRQGTAGRSGELSAARARRRAEIRAARRSGAALAARRRRRGERQARQSLRRQH